MTHHLNRLNETVQMRGHNICSDNESQYICSDEGSQLMVSMRNKGSQLMVSMRNKKNIPQLSSITPSYLELQI